MLRPRERPALSPTTGVNMDPFYEARVEDGEVFVMFEKLNETVL